MHNDFVYINGDVPYYQSRLFQKYNVKHAFFTRIGGVSKGAFESLNFAEGAGAVTDNTENVLENYRIAAKVFGLKDSDICRSYQAHTNVVELATDSDRGRGVTLPKYDHGVDGMVTCKKDLLLSVRTADCVPVLLCDPVARICAAVHAGWRGTVGRITQNAVELMVSNGADRKNIIAAIGPCIGKCCYEVSDDVRDSFINASPDYSCFFTPAGERYMLDLVFANRFILEECGISSRNISCANLCTYCNEEHFYSHRRDGSVRGTLGAFICN